MMKLLRWAASLLVSFSILTFILFLNREFLVYSALQEVVSYYAKKAGIEIEIGTVGGNLLSETNIETLSVLPKKGQPQGYHFKARSITCNYNLWALRGGIEPFFNGLVCTAENPDFMYDFRAAKLQGRTRDAAPEILLPSVFPGLELHNASGTLIGADWAVEVEGMNSALNSAEKGHELVVDARKLRVIQQEKIRVETGFSAKFRYAESRVAIDSLDLGDQGIRATGWVDLGAAGFGGELVFAESRLTVKGSTEKQLLKVQSTTESFDLAELQKRLGGSGWDISGKIRGDGELSYNFQSPGDLAGFFNLEIRNGRLNGVALDTFSAAGDIENDLLRILKAEAKTSANHVNLNNVSIPLANISTNNLLSGIAATQGEFAVELADFETVLKLLNLGDKDVPNTFRPDGLSIHGKLAEGTLFLDDAKAVAPDFSLIISKGEIGIPVNVEDLGATTVNLDAKIESSDLTRLVKRLGDIHVSGQLTVDMKIKGSLMAPQGVMVLTGDDLVFGETPHGSIAVLADIRLWQEKLGKLKEIQVTVSELSQKNNSGTMALRSPLSGNWQREQYVLTGAFLADGKSEIAFKIAKESGREITAEMSAGNLDSDGWLGNFVDNRYFFHGADLKVIFAGPLNSPHINLTGMVDKGGGTDVPFPLTGKFDLQYSSAGIEISEFTWKSHDRNQITLTGRLPYDPVAANPYPDGELSLNGHIDFPALNEIAVFLEPLGISGGSLALDLDLTGSWDKPVGNILLKIEGLEPPAALKKHMDSPANLTCEISANGEAIALKSASLESTDYSAKASGSWQHGISVREILQNRRAKLKGVVKADAAVKLKDLNFLRKKMPWLRRLEGDLQGQIHVEGPVTGPAMKGTFTLQDGELSHVFNFPMLSAVNLQGDFDEQSMNISEMQAELGGSPVRLNGNIYKGENGVGVKLHVEGENVLLLRNNDMRIRGDVLLDVSGPLEQLAIKGTAGLTGGYYTRNIDFLGRIGSAASPVSEGVGFLFSFPEPPLKNAVLDIKVTTVEPFRIRNNLIRGSLRPEISLKGTGELPFLVGTIYIDPSRILLPSGRLQIQSGLLRFLEEKPDRPELDILARSKLLGYDISVVTRGSVADPVITLSSSPALPNDDLLLLLLTGQPPKQELGVDARNKGTTNVMVYLGRDFLSRWLEDESGSSDETILDRFELDLGRSVTRSGEQTVESTFRLSKKLSRTGREYYLSGEKDKYDAYNYGLKLVFRFE